jgi:hypothetical protein
MKKIIILPIFIFIFIISCFLMAFAYSLESPACSWNSADHVYKFDENFFYEDCAGSPAVNITSPEASNLQSGEIKYNMSNEFYNSEFAGSATDYIDGSQIVLGDNFTISFWINGTTQGSPKILEKYDGNNDLGWFIRLSAANKLELFVDGVVVLGAPSGDRYCGLNILGSPGMDAAKLITIKRSGEKVTGWVNATQICNNTYSGTMESASSFSVCVGGSDGDADTVCDGMSVTSKNLEIDDLRIWENYALTDSEISELYLYAPSLPVPLAAPSIYPLDDYHYVANADESIFVSFNPIATQNYTYTINKTGSSSSVIMTKKYNMSSPVTEYTAPVSIQGISASAKYLFNRYNDHVYVYNKSSGLQLNHCDNNALYGGTSTVLEYDPVNDDLWVLYEPSTNTWKRFDMWNCSVIDTWILDAGYTGLGGGISADGRYMFRMALAGGEKIVYLYNMTTKAYIMTYNENINSWYEGGQLDFVIPSDINYPAAIRSDSVRQWNGSSWVIVYQGITGCFNGIRNFDPWSQKIRYPQGADSVSVNFAFSPFAYNSRTAYDLYGAGDYVIGIYTSNDSESSAYNYTGNFSIVECDANADCSLCKKCSANSCAFQASSEDLKSECGLSYSCVSGNNYTRQNYNGFCDGAGACNATALQSYVTVGNVCIDGSDTNPNATVNCVVGKDCVRYNVNASEYYAGYNNSGQCVDVDWQAKGSYWMASTTDPVYTKYISVAEHNLAGNCSLFEQTSITGESCSATTPAEGHSVLMPITFNIYSPSSNNNLVSSSVSIKLQSTNLTGSCSVVNTSVDNSTATCNVSMQYYYPAGLYDLNVSIYDGLNSVTKYRFNSSRCEYYELLASETSSSALTFSAASPGSGNTTADFPIVINNTGNMQFNVTLVSSNLVGRTVGNTLLASYFKVGTTPSYASATQLQEGSVNTSLSIMTSNYGTLYFFVDIPRDVYPQAYYALTPWLIQIS